MLRPCTITQMPARRVREIVCRCWPELHAGRFVTAGSLAQLDRRAAIDVSTPAHEPPELEERRPLPFADRRSLRPRAVAAMPADEEGPFDDVA